MHVCFCVSEQEGKEGEERRGEEGGARERKGDLQVSEERKLRSLAS